MYVRLARRRSMEYGQEPSWVGGVMSKSKNLLAYVWLLVSVAGASAQEIVTLPTRPRITQSYFIAGVPQNPQALVVLFPGSGGLIRLRQEKARSNSAPITF